MPELPEIETIKNKLIPDLVGRKIVRSKAYRYNLRYPIADVSKLNGEKINGVSRRGKYLMIHTKKGDIIIHLGMTGSLKWSGGDAGKHEHFEIELDNGKTLRLEDARRFGCVLFQDKNTTHKILSNMGYEPLDSSFTYEKLMEKLENKKTPIKNAIMDSKVVVGVGNIYANEALFHSRINPKTPCLKLSDEKWRKLHGAILHVLNEGIKLGGASIKDYQHPDGGSGGFIDTVYVYSRAGERCRVCGTEIKSGMMGQRNTFWCDVCQS